MHVAHEVRQEGRQPDEPDEPTRTPAQGGRESPLDRRGEPGRPNPSEHDEEADEEEDDAPVHLCDQGACRRVRQERKEEQDEGTAREGDEGEPVGVPEARNAPDTATATPRVKPRPLRWRGTVGIDVTATSGAARSFRKTNQTRPIETARHTIVMGSR